jgi:3-oxoacyl-[acyl-carrier protein] reductase
MNIGRVVEQRPFSGKKALVIGGTGGIGRAVALALAERGAHLTVHGGSSRERLEETLAAIRAVSPSGETSGFLCPADKPGAAERILSECPAPDILVCAWGLFSRRRLDALDEQSWGEAAWGNLVFPGTIISLAIGGMIQRSWGRILLFGGTNTDTVRGYVTTSAYSAAKTALGVVAKSAARIGADRGVTCNVICPGLTDTEYLGEEARVYNREHSPGGRALTAGDIARIALAVLENPAVNGAVIPADQGALV